MTFNLGVAGFRQFGSFIADINNKKWASAASDMKATLWCRQVGSRCSDDASYVERGCSTFITFGIKMRLYICTIHTHTVFILVKKCKVIILKLL